MCFCVFNTIYMICGNMKFLCKILLCIIFTSTQSPDIFSNYDKTSVFQQFLLSVHLNYKCIRHFPPLRTM